MTPAVTLSVTVASMHMVGAQTGPGQNIYISSKTSPLIRGSASNDDRENHLTYIASCYITYGIFYFFIFQKNVLKKLSDF